MILAIALGGGLGSVLRHYAVNTVTGIFGDAFPYGILLVNVLGSFIIGAIMETMALKWQVPLETRAFLVTGLLGGFTTFSTFSFDVLRLIETNQYITAALYVFLSVALSLTAIFVAVYIVRGVFS
ncbi:MAG: fluoride efflux transporter CrcB [Alphaproteobacteria bacterium]|nr:fluoride efflux transporter CrcB [Alphaproteobacteria bacterium]